METVTIQPWGEDDVDLLRALYGDPLQMAYAGGADDDEALAARQERYLREPHHFRVDADATPAGWVGFWPREWRGEDVVEIGWSVLPARQRHGIATAAVRHALGVARLTPGAGSVVALPSIANAASNALCRRLGFTLHEPPETVAHPSGREVVVNDWILKL